MKVRRLAHIVGQAQDFLHSPRVSRSAADLQLLYDYELVETGGYGEKGIVFKDAKDYRHVIEADVTADMLDAYNSVSEVVDSAWLTESLKSQGYKHYIIYFDEYGAYEVIAKNFRL